ncbi:activating transcription factor-2 isoform X2 [Lycorma delicatula]|uniref:activating transcription factor-2 isoform X2 n=1 Tax=Lycorma delicatula TaxID=130591 RepID=UPI003F50DC90
MKNSLIAQDLIVRLPAKDQLNNYKKKHNMVLHLGTKTNVSSDQTPTPTRFIRNCEEVGLFQDLQNVNPFEETFRKAVEAAKAGIITPLQGSSIGGSTGPLSGVDDTLHTPHVFPHTIESESSVLTQSSHQIISKQQSGNVEGNDINSKSVISNEQDTGGTLRIQEHQNNGNRVVIQEADTSQLKLFSSDRPVQILPNSESVFSTPVEGSVESESGLSVSQSPVQVLLRIPDGRLVQLSVVHVEDANKETKNDLVDSIENTELKSVNNNAVVLRAGNYADSAPAKQNILPNSMSNKNNTSMAKQKLKQALLGNSCPASGMNSSSQKSHSHVTEPKKIPISRKGEYIIEKQPRRNSSLISSEDEEEDKRRKVLERNRIAAMRCREKRKSWVASLERRAEQMGNTNQQLQLEVASLRAEVAQLKTLLLAHKDCPVTQAMAQGNAENPLVPLTTQVFNVTLPVTQNKVISDHSLLAQKPATVILFNPPGITKKRLQSSAETGLRQNLRKKLCNSSTKKSTSLAQNDGLKKKSAIKTLGIDVENARDFQINEKSTSIATDSDTQQYVTLQSVVESFKDSNVIIDNVQSNDVQPGKKKTSKPVATQVIQINPNALHRENITLRLPEDNNLRIIDMQPIVTTAYR